MYTSCRPISIRRCQHIFWPWLSSLASVVIRYKYNGSNVLCIQSDDVVMNNLCLSIVCSHHLLEFWQILILIMVQMCYGNKKSSTSGKTKTVMIVRRKGNYDVHLCKKKLTKTHVKEKCLAHHSNICIHHTILTNALQKKTFSKELCFSSLQIK